MELKEKAVGQNATEITKKSRWVKALVGTLLGLVAVVLLILMATPMFLSSSGGTRFLLGKINNSVDGQVGMESLSLGWFSGVKLTQLTFESGDGATQVKVDRIETRPRIAALFGGQVDMGKTIIDRPQIHLKVAAAPKGGTSTDRPAHPKETSDAGFVLPVHRVDLEVLNGNATIEMTDAQSGVRQVMFKNIAADVKLNEPGTASTLKVAVDVADAAQEGTIRADGEVTPGKGWTLEDTEGTFTVSIQKLNLESLRPLLAMAGQDVQMGGVLNADANVLIKKGSLEVIKADAVVTHFSQGLGDQKMMFSEPVTLTADVGLPGGVLQINALNVKSPFFTAECSGGMETLAYSVWADLAKTQTFAKQFTDLGGLGMAGLLDVAGKLNLGEQTVVTAGRGTIKNLLLSKDGQKAPQTEVALDYDVVVETGKGLLKVPSLTLVRLPGTVSIKNLSMPIGDTGGGIPPIAVNAQATLDLAKAWPYAQILGGAPREMTLAGLLNTAVQMDTKADILQIKTDKTSIQKLRIAKAGSAPFEQDEVRLTADIAMDMLKQSINIKAFDMQGAQGETLIKIHKGKVEQSVEKGVKMMEGQVEAEYDLNAISSMAAPFLPTGLSVEGKRKDNFTFASRWPENDSDKILANLNAAAAMGFAKASYMGLNFGPTELKLNVKQGQAAIDIPDADVNGGKVRFAGDINLAEKPMKLTLRKAATVAENVKIDDIVSEMLLQYLSPVFANSRKVSGMASLSCSELAIPLGGGTPKDINLVGNVSLTDVRLNSPLLGLFRTALRTDGLNLFSIPSTAFTVKNGFVEYAKMPMKFGKEFALLFSGKIGIEQKSLAMDIAVPVSDRMYTIPLTGTLDKPQPDLGRLALSNIVEQIPAKDEKTKEAIDTGLQILEGIFKQPRDKQ